MLMLMQLLTELRGLMSTYQGQELVFSSLSSILLHEGYTGPEPISCPSDIDSEQLFQWHWHIKRSLGVQQVRLLLNHDTLGILGSLGSGPLEDKLQSVVQICIDIAPHGP